MTNRLPEMLIPLLDLTRLEDPDTDDRIKTLCEKAITPKGTVAAVCVYPTFIPMVRTLLNNTVAIASVANFPTGEASLAAVLKTIYDAVTAGANEIDVVLPYRLLLQGQQKGVFDFLQHCRDACVSPIVLKVILETGALLEPDAIALGSDLAIQAGADFIKTSTGKVPVGATLEAARVMLGVIRHYAPMRKVGFKVSGGVRSVAAAMCYVELVAEILGESWIHPRTFRIGTSQLFI